MTEMTKSPPVALPRIAVVGRNVSAALMSWELSAQLANRSEMMWMFTDRDRKWATSSEAEFHWVFHPSAHSGSLQSPLPAMSHRLRQVPFYFDGFKRFSVGPQRLFPGAPAPEAILKRIAALSLWNDFTPDLWRRAKRGSSVPNSRWPQEAPWSQNMWKDWNPVVYHRQGLLNVIAEEMATQGIHVSGNERGVAGIKVGSGRGGHRAVMNVPFEAEAFDKMLWMSRGHHLQREHSASAKFFENESTPHQELVGEWRGVYATVKLADVAALPLFSIWIDEGRRGQLLLRSGRLASNSIKRVFCIPQPEGKVHLLIQELVLREEYNEAFPEPRPLRTDGFLWKICPHLERAQLTWHPLSTTDEELIFLRPDTAIESFERGIGVAPAKTLMNVSQAAASAIEFWKIKKT